MNLALNGKESGNGAEQGSPQSLQKQQRGSVWGAGKRAENYRFQEDITYVVFYEWDYLTL